MDHKGIFLCKDNGRKCPWVWQRVVNGKRIRTFFATLEEAVEWKRKAEFETKNNGAIAKEIFGGKEQREYAAAKRICGGEISVVDACLFWRENKRLFTTKQACVNEVIDRVLDVVSKKNTTAQYVDTIRHAFGLFSEKFGKRKISTIRDNEIVEWLLSFNDRYCALSIRCLATRIVMLFRMAKTLGYIAVVPEISRSLMPNIIPKPVSVYTVDEAREILRIVCETSPQYLAYFALRFFCGLRHSETKKMRWEWIDEDRKRIVVPAQICKTRDNWVLQCPTLPETVFHWLAVIPKREKEGKICSPFLGMFIRRRMSDGQWKKNATRHTFCTMHISLCESAEKTGLLLRHKGTEMMYKHYLASLVPKETAEAYFNLRPPLCVSSSSSI